MRVHSHRRFKGNELFQSMLASRTYVRLRVTFGLALALFVASFSMTGCGTLGGKAKPHLPALPEPARIASAEPSASDASASWKLTDAVESIEQSEDLPPEQAADTTQVNIEQTRVEQRRNQVASVSYEAPVVSPATNAAYRVDDGDYTIPMINPQVSYEAVECAAPTTSMCTNCGTNCYSSSAPCLNVAEPQRKNSNEYIFDGGDQEPSVVVKKDWTAAGVDPTDTVIYYETLGGQVCVKPSNRVPIYAPRFGAVRQVTGVTLAARAVGTERMLAPVSPANIREADLAGNVTVPIAPHGEQQVGMLDAFQENRLGVPIAQVVPPARMSETIVMFEDITFFATGEMIYDEVPVLGRVLANAREWYNPESVEVVIDGQQAALVVDAKRAQDVHVYEMPDKCAMRICKAASHTIANSGDIVRFTIRFDNVGPKPLGNAVVMDSLSARLEYIEGSQQCSVDAKFSTDANDVGSQVLRWEIDEAISPSAGGVISFDCRVR